MRAGAALIGMGLITGVFGLIFHLQGQSVLGPESSFMYSNPEWIDYGLQIMTIAAAISGAGFVILIKTR